MVEPNGRLRALLENVLDSVKQNRELTQVQLGRMSDELKAVGTKVTALHEESIARKAAEEALEQHAARSRTFWEQLRAWIPWIVAAAGMIYAALQAGWRP